MMMICYLFAFFFFKHSHNLVIIPTKSVLTLFLLLKFVLNYANESESHLFLPAESFVGDALIVF